MSIWLFGQGGIGGVLNGGVDPGWLKHCFTIDRTPKVHSAIENRPVWNAKSIQATTTGPPAGFEWTLYSQDTTSDMADWEFTDTATAHRQACANIRSFGRQPFTFPANDVVWRLGPVPHGDQYQAFIGHNLAGTAAQFADVVGVQSQGLTDNTDRFNWYVRTALAQAQAAKPGIPFFAGLATERLGQLLTAGQMYECWHATNDVCHGYWLNVNRRPDVTVDFLRMVYEPDPDAR